MTGRRNTGFVALVAGIALALVLAVLAAPSLLPDLVPQAPPSGAAHPGATAPVPTARGGLAPVPSARISNVVLVLADDLDWKLWNEIPRLKALGQEGATFTNYVVSDSLCCPSRTSLLRGQYVHNHKVVSNDFATGGGWPTFRNDGYPKDCLPTWLHEAGVRTGLVGKYLNEFPATPAEQTSVQPGWDDFVVPISHMADYRGYDYQLDDNGTVRTYGSAPDDFLNDVLNGKAQDFIAKAGDHFFLELATFNPHLPSPVAPRHQGSHAGAIAPRDASYGTAVTHPPAWLAGLPPIGPAEAKHLDRTWAQRAESAESVADSVDAVRQALVASGHDQDTVVIVTSDNGFHVGSYRTHRGKRTAFDTDTVVPMVAIGPGIQQGQVISEMVSETDLAPTITAALGATVPTWVDGRSMWQLLPDLASTQVATAGWRTGVLSESLGDVRPGDPDFELLAPPSFSALRTRKWLYVEDVKGGRELYDRVRDPFEMVNIASSAPPETLASLRLQLAALKACAGPTCRTADALPEP